MKGIPDDCGELEAGQVWSQAVQLSSCDFLMSQDVVDDLLHDDPGGILYKQSSVGWPGHGAKSETWSSINSS